MQAITHETFVGAVAALAIARLPRGPEADALLRVRFTFGHGKPGTFGFCAFNGWETEGGDKAPWIDVSAVAHAAYSWDEIADTVIHELGHALAGPGAGHTDAWRAACERLGLRRAKAAGSNRGLARFAPDLRAALWAMPKPAGRCAHRGAQGAQEGAPVRPPCSHGQGTRGGRSRGPGSGTRNRLYHCQCCEPPIKVRHGGRDLRARCLRGGGLFALQGE